MNNCLARVGLEDNFITPELDEFPEPSFLIDGLAYSVDLILQFELLLNIVGLV